MNEIEIATQEIFAHVLTPEAMERFGVVESRRRLDTAFGDFSSERYPWEVLFERPSGAVKFAEAFNDRAGEITWTSTCEMRPDTNRDRCVFSPIDLIRFVEVQKLHHAISEMLHLDEEEQKRLRITIAPNRETSVPDVNIAVKMGPDNERRSAPDNPVGTTLAEKICTLIGEPTPEVFWERPAPKHDDDYYGLVWRDRYVKPPQRLYDALHLPFPDYMQERAPTLPDADRLRQMAHLMDRPTTTHLRR